MKHELIKTDDYLLVVSNEEIKAGTYCYDEYNKVVFKNNSIGTPGASKKIIAHLPLNVAPYLDGVDVLPEIEDEVEKLAEESTSEVKERDTDFIFKKVYEEFFKEGYNKAKETYKYTLDDLKKAILMAKSLDWQEDSFGNKMFNHSEEEIIKSLNQPKLPIAFECEIQCCGNYSPPCNINCEYGAKSKTITNSEGRTEWVGKYLF